MTIRELYSHTKPAQLEGGGILLRRQQDTLRLNVAMDDVVLVTIAQRLEDLSHVMTENKNLIKFPLTPSSEFFFENLINTLPLFHCRQNRQQRDGQLHSRGQHRPSWNQKFEKLGVKDEIKDY